jgi:ABC-type multidrug transport system ATPase subunit/pSer/pThr/pTyr-binding forkhead associated (FHA) protein
MWQDGADWVIEDEHSTNGTYLRDCRIDRLEIAQGQSIRLADPASGFPMLLVPRRDAAVAVPRPSVDRRPSGIRPLPTQRTLRIGREVDNDLVLPDLMVSRHHAELRSLTDGGYQIVDLNSHNGTYVNGTRISNAVLTETDLVAIGHVTFRLTGGELREYVDAGAVPFAGTGLTVRAPDGRTLLNEVSFPANERCLLAIIGPSGAGKSTLLGALTGMRPADAGTVLYDNRDLYDQYEELRQRIGFVPQEDILHPQLTVRRALRFAADLRFPGDATAEERDGRVEEVIGELGLAARADVRIESLSGGQRKRVSVALELLTKPSLLFLDEPTSGLDPGLDKSVMQMMRGLADGGRTVIVVTHSVANLDLCDRLLVLAPGGHLAYFGPPQEALAYFDQPGWAEAFQALEQEDVRPWKEQFESSPMYLHYVSEGLTRPPSDAAPQMPAPPPGAQSRTSQFLTLTRRYVAVIAADRQYVALLLGLPIGLGLLIRAVPAAHGLAGPARPDSNAEQLLLVLVVAGCFAGAANAVREIVKERAIYRRERATGLSPVAYLLSKFAVLGVITMLQTAVLVIVGLAGRPGPSKGAVFTSTPMVELIVAIVFLGIASMALGLLISALVTTADKTMPLLVLLAMAQVIFSGALVPLHGKVGLDQVSWLAPSRWAMAASSSTVDLNHLLPTTGATPDPLWRHGAQPWLLDLARLSAITLVAGILVLWLLRRLDPNVPRR